MESLRSTLGTILVERVGLSCDAATEIAACAHLVTYDKDAPVFHAGESTDLCYVALNGAVKLYYGTAAGDRMLVTILRAGLLGVTDLDAQDACGTPGRQLFTAQALSRTHVAIIARARLVNALRDLSAAQVAHIARNVNEPWTQLCVRFLEFLTMNVRQRLATAITEIADTFGVTDARGKMIALKLSHEDFSELVGASRPMVSKHLKDLARAGIFSRANGRYVLARQDLLTCEALAGATPTVQDSAARRLAKVARMVPRHATPLRAKSAVGLRAKPRRSPAVTLHQAVK